MKGILLIMACCLVVSVNAQQKKLDSLLKVAANYTKEDTIRLNVLNVISYSYQNIDPDKGISIGQQAMALACKLPYKRKLAAAYTNIAFNFWTKGDYNKAIEMNRQSMVINNELQYNLGVIRNLNLFGLIYNGMGNYILAIQYQQKVLAFNLQAGNKLDAERVYNSIGIDYMYMSNYPEALENYLKALTIAEQINNTSDEGDILDNMGITYYYLDAYPKALAYCEKALHYYKQINEKKGMADAYGNIGMVYGKTKTVPESLKNFQLSLSLYKEINNKGGIANGLVNIGVLLYQYMADYSAALDYIEKALTDYEEEGNKFGILLALRYRANIYVKLPDVTLQKLKIPASQRYAAALANMKQAQSMAIEIKDMDQQGEILIDLCRIYEAQKDYRKEIDAYKQYIVVRDSILNDKKKQAIQQKELQYNFDKKEAAIKAENDKKQVVAQAEIRQQKTVRNVVISWAMLLLVAGAGSFGFYKRKRDADQAKNDAEQKAQVTDTELKALRAQMNPHFIFNSLNSISDYISRNETQAADNYLTKFAKLMRMILENSEEKEVPLAEDLEALEWYIQLEALRMDHKFTYTININDDIDPNAAMIPPMILQPFVENSIWHGLSRKEGSDGHINIRVEKKDNMLCCIVEDNGIGRSNPARDTNMNKRSLGMKITQSRIDVINQQKGTNASIILTDLPQGMKAEIKLPLLLNF